MRAKFLCIRILSFLTIKMNPLWLLVLKLRIAAFCHIFNINSSINITEIPKFALIIKIPAELLNACSQIKFRKVPTNKIAFFSMGLQPILILYKNGVLARVASRW